MKRLRAGRRLLLVVDFEQSACDAEITAHVLSALSLDGEGALPLVPQTLTGTPPLSPGLRAAARQDNQRPATLLAKAKLYVEEQLGQPELSVSMIAGAIHVSTRYLHLMFRSEGVTVSSYVQERRLERSLSELGDLAAGRAIGEVATRVGFKDASHFARAFKKRYGVLPREYRSALAAARSLPA
jgi:AraC-like DNA-binding protein